MNTIKIKTSERVEVERGLNEYEADRARVIPTVEVWIGGIRFAHDCASQSEAMALAERAGDALAGEPGLRERAPAKRCECYARSSGECLCGAWR